MTPFTTEELNDLRDKVKDVKFGMLTTSDDMQTFIESRERRGVYKKRVRTPRK